MAMIYAAHLWNITPKRSTELAPTEVFSGVKSDYQELKNAQVWGCPVYVLEPKLQDGVKIPKWQPRTRRGQYLGVSSHHASTVGLVRNLRTNRITPQFHVVYDDWFETVHADASEIPKEWPDMFLNHRFKNELDGNIQLDIDWLTEAEVKERERVERRSIGRPLTDADEAGLREPGIPLRGDVKVVTPVTETEGASSGMIKTEGESQVKTEVTGPTDSVVIDLTSEPSTSDSVPNSTIGSTRTRSGREIRNPQRLIESMHCFLGGLVETAKQGRDN